MKKIVTIACALMISFGVYSQVNTKNWTEEERKKFQSIDILMENSFFKTAYNRLSALVTAHPEELYLKYRLGVCGLYINEKNEEALNYLKEVHSANKNVKDLEFFMALLYHRTYQFDKAIEIANKLLANKKISANDKKALESMIVNSRNGKLMVENPADVKIANIGNIINTEGAEYSPVVTSDEETIYYTYRGKNCLGGFFDYNLQPDPDGEVNEDVFTAKKVDGQWQIPESVVELNTIDNDAVIAISNDGQQLFLFKANETDNGDIYVSKLEDGKFGMPERLKGEINTNSWEGSLTIYPDNSKIIFASERAGGFGGKDLYVAYRMPDNTWGRVKNLGSTVNTDKDEDAPFIHPDGKSLVFSSEGHNSMGGFDIFASDLDLIDSTWKNPVNLGYPVNSTNDDIFYVISADGKRGYYSSIKKDGFGDHDIYTVEPAIAAKKSALTILKGKMTENLSTFEDGEIIVTVMNDGRNFGHFKPNALSGHYVVNLPSGYDYNVNFYHPVFGEKNFRVITNKEADYSEKVINVNYGINDTSSTSEQTIDFRAPFPSQTPQFTATGTNKDDGSVSLESLKESTAVVSQNAIIVSEDKNVSESTLKYKNITMDPRVMIKYGNLRLDGLKFRVQVAAYRYPKNYNSSHLNNVCGTEYRGKIKNNVTLIVADKEFDTINAACDFLNKIQNAGQYDAFVTAEFNGKRYYINDLPALEVINKQFLASNN